MNSGGEESEERRGGGTRVSVGGGGGRWRARSSCEHHCSKESCKLQVMSLEASKEQQGGEAVKGGEGKREREEEKGKGKGRAGEKLVGRQKGACKLVGSIS